MGRGRLWLPEANLSSAGRQEAIRRSKAPDAPDRALQFDVRARAADTRGRKGGQKKKGVKKGGHPLFGWFCLISLCPQGTLPIGLSCFSSRGLAWHLHSSNCPVSLGSQSTLAKVSFHAVTAPP